MGGAEGLQARAAALEAEGLARVAALGAPLLQMARAASLEILVSLGHHLAPQVGQGEGNLAWPPHLRVQQVAQGLACLEGPWHPLLQQVALWLQLPLPCVWQPSQLLWPVPF